MSYLNTTHSHEDVKEKNGSNPEFVRERPINNAQYGDETESLTSTDAIVAQLVDEDHQNEISFRTMSWQKCAALLFGDQVCLAIMAQAWSFSVLGWVGGLITTFGSGIFFWVTSLTLHKYMMRHPGEINDICDIGYLLAGRKLWAYEFTFFMLLANNILLIGFHCLTGAKILNTLSEHSICTVGFSAITAVIGIVVSLPRTLNHVSLMSIFSACCMFISIILCLSFAGAEANPATGYDGDFPIDGPVRTYAFAPPGTTWVSWINAILNITFLWIPQILFPGFINEMKRPQDFPKALAALAGASFLLFIVPAIVGYRYFGQYTEAPAFGSLEETYKKAASAFVIVPTVIIGAIYSNSTCKAIYRRVMRGSWAPHQHKHSAKGWGVWVFVTVAVWGLAFIFAEIIPSFGDFLSLLGAAFDPWFGYLFWVAACFQLARQGAYKNQNSLLKLVNYAFHIVAVFIGLFLLGPGLYAAVEAIIVDYSAATRPAFSCNNLAL